MPSSRRPLREDLAEARAVECSTQISGLQVAGVLDGNEVIGACRATGGTGHLVDDDEVYEVQARLARDEGLFCEPAAAVSVAGALAAAREGRIQSEATVACLMTSTGFKDTPSVDRLAGAGCPLVDVAEINW